MPVTYRIDRNVGLIRTVCSGNVVMREVVDHFRALEDDPNRPTTADVLLDLREVTSLPTADQLRTTTVEIARLAPRLRFRACAIIAGRDALFGISRMFGVFAENYFRAISVFRSAEEGERWLDECRNFGRESAAE